MKNISGKIEITNETKYQNQSDFDEQSGIFRNKNH